VNSSDPGPKGYFRWSGFGPDGRLLWRETIANGWTTEGENAFLSYVFNSAILTTPFMGLIAGSGFSAVSVNDTYAGPPAGWAEWTAYSGNRPPWNAAPATGGGMATTIDSTWVMSAAGTLRGVFLATVATKTFAPGPVLFCTAVAPANQPVSIGTVVVANYTVRLRTRS
jgi:hypothetical protein